MQVLSISRPVSENESILIKKESVKQFKKNKKKVSLGDPIQQPHKIIPFAKPDEADFEVFLFLKF